MDKQREESNQKEILAQENEFLKMKIMLEHGAQFFSDDGNKNIPAAVENEFLKGIIEFEKQFSNRQMISVFEKLGKPTQFKPSSEIPDHQIKNAWRELSALMAQRGVELLTCSPKVTARELYRFTIDELFCFMADNIDMPNVITSFIYDEFYPDKEFNNRIIAADCCIAPIFNKKPSNWLGHFSDSIQLNDHTGLNKDEYTKLINRFQNAFDQIHLKATQHSSSTSNDSCLVCGHYAATARFDKEVENWAGEWRVEFRLQETGVWLITNVSVENIRF